MANASLRNVTLGNVCTGSNFTDSTPPMHPYSVHVIR